jgi:branched-chain amino acid transport system ATP-binding protein
MPLLEVEGLTAGYGPSPVLDGVGLKVDEGQVVALIGANGAGKTTTLRAITGVLRPRSGSVRLAGERLDGLAPHEIVRRGVSLSPEGRGLFPRMTVRENLELGAYLRRDTRRIAEDREWVLSLLPRLGERLGQGAATLSGGEQQMVAIGRALMARPRLLLLDEPAMGLSPLLVRTVFQIIQEISRRGTPILLVEQNARMALAVAAHGYVLQTGRVVRDGPAADLQRDPEVARAYLGETHEVRMEG